jgi:16S rRNA processing protein RimM
VAGPRLRERVELTIETVRGDEGFPIIGFREIEGRDAAEALCGYVLQVHSTDLPELEEDEFYPFDLVGLEARDPSGAVLGRITDALESPAHDILVITLESGGEALVPFVQAAVPVVAADAGYLVVDPALVSVSGSPGESEHSRP